MASPGSPASRISAAALMAMLAVLALAAGGSAQLQYGFYKGKCNGSDVEAVVQGIVKAHFARENPIVAYLLRMQFHECATAPSMYGCDGGLLIDGPGTEKTAAPNLSVKGYDLIAAIKTALEGMCPGVVSCSDIQILATRDAVALAGAPAYAVRTGRRDRRQSRASDVRLPAPDYTAAQAVFYYARLGMNAFETVALLGAHTVGTTRCSAIKSSRLYGYGGKPGATDPDMDPATASVYKKWVCPNVSSSDGNAVFLDDQWSALKVDNHYYRNLQLRRGQARPWGVRYVPPFRSHKAKGPNPKYASRHRPYLPAAGTPSLACYQLQTRAEKPYSELNFSAAYAMLCLYVN